MRALLPAAVAIAVSLAGLAAGIAAGDRQLFVPPPESVAESFVRQLAARRYDRARPLLSRAAAAKYDAAALARIARTLEDAVGAIEQVEGIAGVLQSDTSRAFARVQGASRDDVVAFDLVRERGLWKIEGWTQAMTGDVSMDKVKQEDEQVPKQKPAGATDKRQEAQDRRKAPRRAPEFNPTSRGDESGEVT